MENACIDWLAQTENVLEVLTEGVVITDDQHRIVFANSRFIEMTGISNQELVGFKVAQFYSAQEWDFVEQRIQDRSRDGQNRYQFVLPRKDGSRLPVIISSRKVENQGNQIGIVTFADISEQVRVADELRCVNARLKERQMEIEEDLRLAERVQKSLAPKSIVSGRMNVDAFYHPARSIGGDIVVVDAEKCEQVSLLVCDVSGHGIGSALVANRIYSETTSHLRSGMPFTDMFAELNRFLLEDICGSGMFVTAAAVRIDACRLSMMFAGAGHPPAMLARRGQDPLLLESQNTILGALPNAVDNSNDTEVELEPDDRIVLYTDGLTEVFDSRGEMLGVSGIQEIVRKLSFRPGVEMKQGILDGVAAWQDGMPTDDASLMVVHVR
jgi:PAS domain S-box-containing protein